MWAALVTMQANLARHVKAAGESVPEDVDEILQAARSALDIAARERADQFHELVSLGEEASRYWDVLAAQKGAATTGLAQLDKALGGGFQPRRVVGLMGTPGMGKSTLANQLAEHMANAGRPVVYLTLEDTPHIMLCRTMARISGINFATVQRPAAHDRERIERALVDVSRRESASRLLYLEECSGLRELYEVAAPHFEQYQDGGPGLLVIDYLQRLARAIAGGKELRQAVSDMADQLRPLAKSLNCSVLALMSQSRAGYGSDGAAALASAKESGDIEYGCDVLLSLGEDKDATPPVGAESRRLYLAKNRQGQAGVSVHLTWTGGRQQFTSAGGEE
jgi:replicative DNA helicase